MPIYEYRCSECGSVTEFLHKGSSEERLSCSNCGSSKLERILSPSFVSVSSSSGAGRTCCDRDTPCEVPPCADDGTCRR